MSGVLTGFAVLIVVAGVGYFSSRTGLVPRSGEAPMTRVVFYLATPALLFTTLLDAPLGQTFSGLLVGIVLSSLAAATIFVLVAGVLWRRSVTELTIGAMTSSYANAANLGIPIAAYVLGDAAYVAPLLLYQLLLASPVALAILDVSSPGASQRSRRAWLRPLANPVIVGSVLGISLGAADVPVPPWILEPVGILAGAAVPLTLLLFGMSLNGVLRASSGALNRDVTLATFIKVVIHPLIAYVLGRWALGLDGDNLFALTVIAALPTAQNVYIFAVQYGRSTSLARTVVLLTTILAVPALLVVAAVFS